MFSQLALAMAIAQVAPEQAVMTVTVLKPQPKIPGNRCCCMCCGGAPPDIDVSKIFAAGGKYAQARVHHEAIPLLVLWRVVLIRP